MVGGDEQAYAADADEDASVLSEVVADAEEDGGDEDDDYDGDEVDALG